MGVTYQRLLSSPGSRPARARAWALLRWAAVRLSCAARRRWCVRARRLAWPGLGCVGRGGAGAPPERRVKGRNSAAVAGYDSASYARNFDDGAWKADEGLSWAGPGVGARAGGSGAVATGDPVPSSL